MEIANQETVLLDFYSDTCAPCKTLMRDLEDLIKEFSNLTIQKCNIMENWDLTEEYKITSVPTLIILKNQMMVNRYTGYKGKEDLKKFLTENT